MATVCRAHRAQFSLIETCWTCVNLVATDNKAIFNTYLFKIDCCMPSFPCLFREKRLLENTGNGIPEHLEASLEDCAFTARLPSCLLHHYSLLLKNLLKSLKNFLKLRLNTCTVEEPSDPWDPTFTLGQIENLGYFSPKNHAGHSTCNLLFTDSEHWDPFNFL